MKKYVCSMRRAAAVLIVAVTMLACSRETPVPVHTVPESSPAIAELKAAVDADILSTLEATRQPYNWNDSDDDILMSALLASDTALVVGYADADARSALSAIVHPSDVLFEEDVLRYFTVKVRDAETLRAIRNHPATEWVEANDYLPDLGLLPDGQSAQTANDPSNGNSSREMVLDPNAPDYPGQVQQFDGGLYTVMRRHNMFDIYREEGHFGESVGIAIIDNGVLPERLDFFEDNGYGDRVRTGYYNFLWWLPFTRPDGWQPRPTDVFGLSILIYDTYYIHGSEMIEMVLTLAPNADIWSVRGSTWTVILTADQVEGIAAAIRAMTNEPDIRMLSMSMGTIFHFNRIAQAIRYFHAAGKLPVVSAGSTFAGVADLLGVLFPGQMPETVTATAILNRESTGGAFELTEGVHGGPENDFCVESTNSSSVAASRTAGMIAAIWSANPELSRDELIEVLIQSSYFYQETGQKDDLFGWGTIDAGLAVELAGE